MSIYIQIDDPYKVIKKMSQKNRDSKSSITPMEILGSIGAFCIVMMDHQKWYLWSWITVLLSPKCHICSRTGRQITSNFFFQWNMANCGYPSTLNEKFGWWGSNLSNKKNTPPLKNWKCSWSLSSCLTQNTYVIFTLWNFNTANWKITIFNG